MMEEALVARLLAKPAITLMVDGRINWLDRPTPVLPSITMTVVHSNREYNHDGPDDLQMPRVQFDFWGVSYAQSKMLYRAVLSEMEVAQQFGTVLFEPATEISSHDMPKETLDGGTQVFRYTLEMYVPFRMI